MTTRKPLSPIEVQSATFRRVFRGLDPDEVQLFLQAAAESYQALTLENQRLLKDKEHLEAALEEFRHREGLLRDALYTAQKVSDDLKAQALREAQSTVQEAEIKAQALIQQAQLRATAVERQILDLRAERRALVQGLRDLVVRLSAMVEALAEEEKRENVATLGRES